MKNWSLKWQILALIVSIVTVAVTALTVLTIAQIRGRLNETLEEEALNLSAILAANAGANFEFYDTLQYSDVMNSAINDADVVGFRFYDLEGKVILEQSVSLNAFPDHLPCSLETEGDIVHTGDRLVLERPIYSRGQHAGCLQLILTKEPLIAEINSSITVIIAMAVLLVALSALLGTALSRRVVKPIKTFERAATRISSCDMTTTVDTSTIHRDFFQLGAAFNKMQGALQHAFSELNESRNHLEEQFDARTSELQNELAERRRAEAALHDGQALLRATLESTADGILVVNSEGKVTHANARFAEMWQIPGELIESGDDGKLLAPVLDHL